jgi:hypothetical protein
MNVIEIAGSRSPLKHAVVAEALKLEKLVIHRMGSG